MESLAFTGCDYIQHELWIAGTVCVSGWTCFLIALAFLTTSVYFESKRVKKTQHDIIAFRTSSRNAILEASLMTKASATPVAVVNTAAYLPSPPPANSTFHLQPPPVRQVIKPNEVRDQELPNSRMFINSFSYTSTRVPLESQTSYQSQGSPNYNIPSPPPVPPRWTATGQSYSTNR